MLLDITMAIFFRVKLRSIWRQFFDEDFRLVSQICFCLFAGMNAGSIPNQNELAWNVSLNMFQCCNQRFTIDRTFKMLFVDFAREGQRYRSGYCATLLRNSAEDRTFSPASPSRRQLFLKGKAKFIPKYDGCPEPPRLFLSLANLVATMP